MFIPDYSAFSHAQGRQITAEPSCYANRKFPRGHPNYGKHPELEIRLFNVLEEMVFKQKRKRKGLANEIAKATNRTNSLSETVHDTILERATTNKGVLEHGEITSNVPVPTVNTEWSTVYSIKCSN